MQKETLVIIDGSSYIFRAFYAVQDLSTSKGVPTNAVFGFVNMLMRVLEEKKPKNIVIAFDTPAPSFRKALFPDYKSNRQAPPEELIQQFPFIFRAVDALQIHRLSVEGFEADDIIGTLACQAEKKNFKVEIISGDKDLMQLIGKNITLYDSMKEVVYDSNAVYEKFQVRPEQMVDFLALMGDCSDNIPGVAGIGKKTAAELLKDYHSLDGIYQNLKDIKQAKRRETLEREKKLAYLSQKLCQIDCNMNIPIPWNALQHKGPDKEKLKTLFEELEFFNLLKRFEIEPSKSYQRAPVTILRTENSILFALKNLCKCELVSVDTETTSLSPHHAKLIGISLCGSDKESFYIPIGHTVWDQDKSLVEGQISDDKARHLLKPFLENASIPKVGQNLKYDIQILMKWGVEVHGMVSDTMVSSYLLDPDQKHGLDSLTLKYLNHRNITYEEVTGKGKNQRSFAEVPIELAADYSAEDAEVTLALHHKMLPELKQLNLLPLYEKVEVPLIEVLAQMEYAGILIDEDKLKEMSLKLKEELIEKEASIHKLAGEKFNINSPKQLSQILYNKLKLPVLKKTKTGISTDESVLAKLSKEHDICRHLLSFRALEKLRSTYVDGLLLQIHPDTKKIHTSYNQTVTATGRLSSSNPNLQNIPVSGESEFDIRSVFIPSKGCELLSADYSQVELRLLADMSGDEELLQAFDQGEDVHGSTAKLIFSTNSVNSEQRRIAKTINFGVIYGQTPFGLSQTLGISVKEAEHFITTYFRKYSRVKTFLKELVENARSSGFATTKLGRRRKVGDVLSVNRIRREMAERMAINTPIQGSAADMIKVAMVNLNRRLLDDKLHSKMLLQVHDELVLEVLYEEKSQVEKCVKEEMENALALKVALRVDTGWGCNWSKCK